jgi:hypothetical protein
MKRFLTFLMTVMALFAFSTNVMAQQNVFLETEQTINGINNGWNNNGPQFTHYEGTTWMLKVTSMPDDGFHFRVRVDGWDKPMQPCEEDGKNVLQLDGELYALYPSGNGKTEGDFYGAERAWWVKGYKGVYDYLEIYVNLTDTKQYRGVSVVGKKNTVTPPTPTTPPTRSTITPPAGYYLVGNFFSPCNKAEVTPGPDGDHINYNRHYFKFAQNKEGTYTIDIPACLTAKMQILAADDAGDMKVYGPKDAATSGISNQHPTTNGNITGALTGSDELSESSPYWSLTTRNDDKDIDDDGMYTVSFTMDADGNPTAWTIQHDALTRVAYLLNTSYGATAQPIYDKRDKNEGAFTDNAKAFLHFNGKKTGYYVIDYIVSDVNLSEEAKQATPGIHATKSINNSSGTHDKLFFLGNDGTEGHKGKLAPNWPSFTLNLKGMKEIEYNANRGDNDLAQKSGSYGMSGSFSVINNTNTADYPNSISLVGDAIPGTTNEDGSWNWASKAAKMTYDANERCYKVTIETTDANYERGFRFVGNHSQAYNWHEDTTTDESKMAKSDNKNATGHSCLPSDPNFLSYTTTGATTATEAENNINWNRKAGIHVVKLYIITDGEKPIYKYTIETTENIGIPFTYRAGKFIRTYSNSVAMNVVSKDVKIYEAYKYVKAQDETDIYSPGTLHLRQLNYIPANVGVVLIGTVPATNELSDGDKLDFILRKRTEDEVTAENPTQYVNVWTNASKYTGQPWNNFLAPTVVANNSLGNTEKEGETVTYRYYGLGNYHRTKYYNEHKEGDDYIGFFRLTPDGRSDANKAYLRMPASADVEGGAFGYISYNSQFIGPKDEDDASLAKMMIVFDDEEMGGVTEIKNVETVKTHHDNAYYTLQGIKVLHPTKGIYIHNGKKIVIK